MHIKRLVCLCLTLCLCLAVSPAWAIQGVLEEGAEDTFCQYLGVAPVGNDLWLLRNRNGTFELLRHSTEDGTSTLYTETAEGKQLDVDPYRLVDDSVDRAEKPIDTKHTLHLIASDGETLYGMNLRSGLLMKLTDRDGKIAFEELTRVSDQRLLMDNGESDFSGFYNLTYAFVQNGQLYYGYSAMMGEDAYGLRRVNLATGEAAVSTVKHIQALCPCGNGKIAAVVQDKSNAWDRTTRSIRPASIGWYDPAADTFQEQTTHALLSYAIAYSTALNRLLFVSGGKVMGLRDWKDENQIGYLPGNNHTWLTLLRDGSLVGVNDRNSAVLAAELREDFDPNRKLMIANTWSAHADAFIREHPDVAVYQSENYLNTAEQIQSAAVSGDDGYDLLSLSLAFQPFDEMAEKGYCLDLSGYPELMERVNHLYPVYRDAVLRDGKLYGVPTEIQIETLSGSTEQMENLGIKAEDIPNNLVDLMAFMNKWEAEMDDHPDMQALDTYASSIRFELLNRLTTAYADYQAAHGEALTFDTPLFRQLMQAWEKVHLPKQEQLAKEKRNNGGWADALLQMSYDLMNSGTSPWSEGAWRKPMLMKLTADTELVIGAQLTVMTVNPRTADPDLAAECLLSMLNHLDPIVQVELFDDRNDPVEDPYYAKNAESLRQNLIQTEEALADATDEADKKNLQEQIENIHIWQQSLEKNNRYRLSPADIKKYQNDVLPYLTVRRLNPLLYGGGDEIVSLFERVSDGQIDTERLIREVDQKLRMMRLENQ